MNIIPDEEIPDEDITTALIRLYSAEMTREEYFNLGKPPAKIDPETEAAGMKGTLV